MDGLARRDADSFQAATAIRFVCFHLRRFSRRTAAPVSGAAPVHRLISFGVRRPKRRGEGALDWLTPQPEDRFKAVSRYDHPIAAAALGTPVLATALQIDRNASGPDSAARIDSPRRPVRVGH